VILFQDTFATHASGWPQVTGATGKLAYSGGSYHVLVARGNKTAHPSTAQLSRPVSFGNAAIQAGITKVAGAGTYSFGVFCRSSAPETFYRFEVRNDGVLVIARQAGARLNVLAHSPAPASGLVRKTNSVSAVCVGGAGGPARLRLVLNGKTLTAVDKRPLAASGAVGMLASTGKNGRVEVAFDRFTVRVR
jgi:hypothetical protein